jgi:hypothetical protein
MDDTNNDVLRGAGWIVLLTVAALLGMGVALPRKIGLTSRA